MKRDFIGRFQGQETFPSIEALPLLSYCTSGAVESTINAAKVQGNSRSEFHHHTLKCKSMGQGSAVYHTSHRFSANVLL